jgi:hypothetical protein
LISKKRVASSEASLYLYGIIKIKVMKIIPRIEVREKLNGLKNGTIYSVTFIKKDGSLRVMNSIKGTHKGVTGEGLKYDASEKGLIPVYDLQLARKGEAENKCWRMVNIQTVKTISVDHEIFSVED